MVENPQYRKGVQFVIARRFYSESEAHLYKIKLEAHGIPCFISNAISSTILPFNEGGFLLHVKATDIQEATNFIQQIDSEIQTPGDEDFRDAELGDIFYEKSRQEYESQLQKSGKSELWIFYLIMLLTLGYTVWYFFNNQ